jgi:hypothetical protein
MASVPVEATNWYKCPLTEARRVPIQPNWYKCLTFVPGGGSGGTNARIGHLYWVRICTGTNVGDICTGQPNHPVQASLPAPLTSFSKSCRLFYSVFPSSSSFSLVLFSFFILLSSHISLDLPRRAPGRANRRCGGRRGGRWCGVRRRGEAGSIW